MCSMPPGYDAWKLESPYDMTAAEERAAIDRVCRGTAEDPANPPSADEERRGRRVWQR